MSTSDIYIGLMSGTSLDGIDVAAIDFSQHLAIVATHSETIPDALKKEILQLTQPNPDEIDLMGKVDIELGKLFAKAVNTLISQTELSKTQIQAIGSHGQTIRHRPEFGFTLQIGDANIIAEHTGITTVADFRRRDMAASGQGAPLVPAFHKAVLHNSAKDRILLNIGGMANITYLPADKSKITIGFDTGPGNVLMDAWIHKHKALSYDHDGEWAQSGNCDVKLLEKLLSLPYFHEAPPKSTGREQFHLGWLTHQLEDLYLSPEDTQATLLELTAASIVSAIQSHVASESFELLVCGGGSRNKALMERLKQLLPNNDVSTTDKVGINADWMEAAAFAWLAKRCLEGKTGNNTDVTGAAGERILGAIYQA